MTRKTVLFVAAFLILLFGGIICPEMRAFADEKAIQEPLRLKVTLEKQYLDGEISQEHLIETVTSWEDFWSKYENWATIDISKHSVTLRKREEDISPLLKSNGYFGLGQGGVLAIFNGRPPYSQIIQSFFQIDVKKLESKRHEELKEGIPILTKDRYVEVLESYVPYSSCESH
ncbi:hypothetical protein A8F94_05090 [Bacillus sp. FJAT-27225]|uniref:BofC C-terminal domain-containing protein n=1 Tax=Bacillus sp. FJAT-27225 TaxID=1743144 RepID=UPI00080C328F|nr:BofC C-terminal domain-containing protein [Bacillus sp. FJAT-27225]OCA91237.1 hypothetical protein A8F94_05090 [Bacillus sp. FJAT-27225]